MKTVGIRELKNRLSEYLRVVRSGESVLVTDRGEVIAELSPPGAALMDPTIPAGLVALAREGQVTLASSSGGTSLYPRLERKGTRRLSAKALLEEERGSH